MNYLVRSEIGIKVVSKTGEIQEIKKGLIEYLNQCAMKNLSTYEGRVKSVKNVLGITSKIPVYIDHENLFFPSKGIRNYDCVFINYCYVLSTTRWHSNQTRITFHNLTDLIIDVEYKKINIQIKKCEKIISHIT